MTQTPVDHDAEHALESLDADNLTESQAMDRIAALLGSRESWSGESISEIAEIVGKTYRPDPGSRNINVMNYYRRRADALGIDYPGKV